MTSLIPSPTVSLVDGKPMVSSRDVALRFQRKHQHVLRDIERIISMCPKSFSASNFGRADYLDEQGKTRPAYHLTRDAFSLLAMGFTGKAAIQWKIRYIEAFNTLEMMATSHSVELARAQGRLDRYSPERVSLILNICKLKDAGLRVSESAAALGVSRHVVGYAVKRHYHYLAGLSRHLLGVTA